MWKALTNVAVMVMAGHSIVVLSAEPTGLGFLPMKDGGYAFNTGFVRGRLQADGKNQGITSLIDIKTGVELAHAPGAMSYYRVFSRDTRYGDAARKWPCSTRRLDDGAVEIRYAAAKDRPFDLVGIFRWVAPDALDVTTTISAKKELPEFELFLSSYFSKDMRAYAFVRPNFFSGGKPYLMPVDVNPMVDGTYLMFPRDRSAILTIFDGRWELPPHPVQWSVARWMESPLAVRRFERNGLAVAMMAPKRTCFAMAMPYNKTPPDGPSSHASMYFSLFGDDLNTGQSVGTRCRLVIAGHLNDEQLIERYGAFAQSLESDREKPTR